MRNVRSETFEIRTPGSSRTASTMRWPWSASEAETVMSRTRCPWRRGRGRSRRGRRRPRRSQRRPWRTSRPPPGSRRASSGCRRPTGCGARAKSNGRARACATLLGYAATDGHGQAGSAEGSEPRRHAGQAVRRLPGRRQRPRLPRVLRPAGGAADGGRVPDECAARDGEHADEAPGRLPPGDRARGLGREADRAHRARRRVQGASRGRCPTCCASSCRTSSRSSRRSAIAISASPARRPTTSSARSRRRRRRPDTRFAWSRPTGTRSSSPPTTSAS